jgi:hypothetical protein
MSKLIRQWANADTDLSIPLPSHRCEDLTARASDVEVVVTARHTPAPMAQ